MTPKADAEYMWTLAKHMVEDAVAKGAPSCPPMISMERDDASFLIHIADSDDIGPAVTLLPGLFRADAIALSTDAYSTRLAKNPDTGQDWAAGEMAPYMARHPGGAVSEALNIVTAERAGDDLVVALHIHPYRREIGGRHRRWQAVWEESYAHGRGKAEQTGGRIADAIRAGFAMGPFEAEGVTSAELDSFAVAYAQRTFEADVWVHPKEATS